MNPPIPANESSRLEALRRYRILDTAAEEAYDDITEIAASVTGCPTAMVTLVDADRQWFKSKIGSNDTETPRDVSFCAHAILHEEMMVVPDATRDTRFCDNRLVTSGPLIRFYAGAPLINQDGYALGTLCVIDQKPHRMDAVQKRTLSALARQVSLLFEMRLNSIQLAETLETVKTLKELLPMCAYCRRIRDDDGYWEALEDYVANHSSTNFSHGICMDCADKYFPKRRTTAV